MKTINGQQRAQLLTGIRGRSPQCQLKLLTQERSFLEDDMPNNSWIEEKAVSVTPFNLEIDYVDQARNVW